MILMIFILTEIKYREEVLPRFNFVITGTFH